MFDRHVALHLHFIWGTERRVPWVSAAIGPRIHAVIAAAARSQGCAPVHVGGVDEHVHVLLRAPPTITPSKLIGHVKGVSSRFAHEALGVDPALGWQEGYALFSVDPRAEGRVAGYVRDQRRRHALGLVDPAWELPVADDHDAAGPPPTREDR